MNEYGILNCIFASEIEDEIIERMQLDEMPFDHRFNGKNCHSTGYMVHMVNTYHDEWWNEYKDGQGNVYYGR